MSYSQALETLIREQRKWETRTEATLMEPAGVLAAHFPRGNARSFMVDHLRYAEPFFIAPDIGAIITAAGAVLPDTTLDRSAIPSRVGWLWFSTPLRVPGLRVFSEYTCMLPVIRAMSWAVTERELSGRVFAVIDGQAESGSVPHGVNVLAYFDCADGEGPHFAYIDSWPHAERLSEVAPADAHGVASQALDGGEQVAPFCRRAFFSFCSFVQQRIFTSVSQRAERHTCKRLEREGFMHEPLIRVIQLRRSQAHAGHHGDGEPIEWSHQWIVSGHWRQQWYPSLNANQPRWIMPYVKGPEDKPLKPPRAKVFAVIR